MSFFQLKTPVQLFEKLESDLKALSKAESDAYLAFNFFVTAEHLPDWLGQRPLVKMHALLRVVSHIANGAKHFTVDPHRHSSVNATARETYAEDYADNYCQDSLFVYLSAEEANALGKPAYNVLELGRLIIDFWRPRVFVDQPC
jgi:hypothetical protein